MEDLKKICLDIIEDAEKLDFVDEYSSLLNGEELETAYITVLNNGKVEELFSFLDEMGKEGIFKKNI